MNICVTLNPCMDKTLVVPPWQPGMHQVRGKAMQHVVGGKGVNVARALKRLEAAARPALFLGGEVGRHCHRLLQQQDDMDPLVVWTEAPTREILTVRTEDTSEQTAFFDPNPEIRDREAKQLLAQIERVLADGAAWCIMSGSSPCRSTDTLYAQLVQAARRHHVSTLVDTYGPCLLHALEASPDVVKINRRECEQVLQQPIDSPIAIENALRWLVQFGPACAAITFGEKGVAAIWNDTVHAWKPPAINVVNPIGAGDAMAAGLADALTRGETLENAFRWAMACAVSSVERWTACDISRQHVETILPQLQPCDLDELL